MAYVSDDQVEELKDILRTPLDSIDVLMATLQVVKRRLEATAEMPRW